MKNKLLIIFALILLLVDLLLVKIAFFDETKTIFPSSNIDSSFKNDKPWRGKIAYVSSGNIWLVNPDGTENVETPINKGINKIILARYIAWSPDGDKLAFVSNEGYTSFPDGAAIYGLYVFDFVRSKLQKIPTESLSPYNGTNDGPVAWSPDSTKIAFIDMEKLSIYDISNDKKHPEQGHIINSLSTSFDWSPDSNEILYVEGDSIINFIDDSGNSIRTLNAYEIGVEKNLPNGLDQSPIWASWGRNGKEILIRTYGGITNSYLYNLSDSNKKVQLIHKSGLRMPYMTNIISPDRNKVLGIHSKWGQKNGLQNRSETLLVFDFNGVMKEIKTPDLVQEGVNDYSWSPNGEEIVVTVTYKDLVVINLNGTSYKLPYEGTIAAWNPVESKK